MNHVHVRERERAPATLDGVQILLNVFVLYPRTPITNVLYVYVDDDNRPRSLAVRTLVVEEYA